MENLKSHIKYLENLIVGLSDYQARNGKNTAIREKESSNISHAAYLLQRYLDDNPHLSALLLEYQGGNAFGYNETVTFQYVVRDTRRFIDFLKDKQIEGNGKNDDDTEK